MNFTPYVVLWVLFGLVTTGLALYRKLVSMKEDVYLHLGPVGAQAIPKQVASAGKLNVIDRWGETLTVATVAFGLILAAVYLYTAWTSGAQ